MEAHSSLIGNGTAEEQLPEGYGEYRVIDYLTPKGSMLLTKPS